MGVAAVAALLRGTHTTKNVEFWRLRRPGVQQTAARPERRNVAMTAAALSLSLSLCSLALPLSRCLWTRVLASFVAQGLSRQRQQQQQQQSLRVLILFMS